MKTKLLFLLMLTSTVASAQWTVMQKFSELGQGNYYLFAATDKDAKRIITETLQDNRLDCQVNFDKNANLFAIVAIVDPLNSEYVYIIHCIRGRRYDQPGLHIFCYYMENRYRYFYDVTEGENRISLVYDPGIIRALPTKNGKPKKD